MTTRNQSLDALQTRLRNPAMGFVTVSRKLVMFDKVAIEQMPACYIVDHADTIVSEKRNAPHIRLIEVELFIYANSTEQVGSEILNDILDNIESIALKPDFENRVTFDGLVYDCYVDGRIVKDPGDVDNLAIAVVPLKIMVP